MFYPLTSSSWGEEEIEAATAVLRSGRTTMGEKTLEFEAAFCKFFGCKHAVFCNSGSSANLLSIGALTFTKDKLLQPGDEVLVPAIAWATTYFPLHQYGLRMRLVDVDLETLNIGFNSVVLDRFAYQPRAVLGVNLLGNPCDLEAAKKLKKDWLLNLIEDNCESMGATFNGKYCGTFGKVGTFSTFFSHHICTGEGGVVITDDDEIDQILRCLRSHGWTRELPKENYVQNKGEDEWQEKYRFALPGYNLRPTEIAAAVGIVQLQRLPELLEGRRKNAKLFRFHLDELNKWDKECIVTSQKPVGNPSYYGFPLILRGRLEGKRKGLVNRLTEAGIETRPVMSGNMQKSPVAWRFGNSFFTECPNASYVDANGLFVGNSHLPLDAQLEKTFEVIRKYAEEN